MGYIINLTPRSLSVFKDKAAEMLQASFSEIFSSDWQPYISFFAIYDRGSNETKTFTYISRVRIAQDLCSRPRQLYLFPVPINLVPKTISKEPLCYFSEPFRHFRNHNETFGTISNLEIFRKFETIPRDSELLRISELFRSS